MIYKLFIYLLRLFFLPFWWLQKLIPRNKKIWVFGGWYGLKYSDNAKVLFEYIINHNPDIYPVWLTKNPDIVRKLKLDKKNCELAYSLKGILYSLKAGCVIFSSGKQDVNPFLINGAILINTWHGAPMKKIGLDDKYSSESSKNIIIKTFFPFLWEYEIDFFISTADIFNEKLCSAFNLSIDKVICSGYPRNDLFFSEKIHPLIEEWNIKFNHPIKIFYLPTFRSASVKFNPFLSYDFNEPEWQKFLEENNTIFISKGHFVDKKLEVTGNSNRLIHLIDKDVEELNLLLKDTDILITDYSGVYFDFLLTNKPIILAPFDLDEYISKSRELYFDYYSLACGPVCNNWNEIRKSVSSIFKHDDFGKIRAEKNNIFNKHKDGNSSKRLSDFIHDVIINEA